MALKINDGFDYGIKDFLVNLDIRKKIAIIMVISKFEIFNNGITG